MRLTRFANDRINYVFPRQQTTLDANFGGRRATTVSVMGIDGGFDLAGDKRWQAEIGNVRVTVILERDEGGSVRDKVDRIYELATAGRGRLFADPGDGLPIRWAWAKINDIQASENVRDVPHLRQFVTINMQVAGARWYSREDATYGTDGTPTLGTDPRVTAANRGHNDTFALTNDGNEYAAGVFTVTAQAGGTWTIGQSGIMVGGAGVFIGAYGGQSATGGKIQRLDASSTVLDEVALSTLTASSSGVINTEDWSVTGLDYATFAAGLKTGAWLAIPPGATVYRLQFTDQTSLVTVGVNFWDTWITG